MKKEEFLRTVRKQIHFVFDRDDVESELNQHLSDSMEDLMEEGLSIEEAEYLQGIVGMSYMSCSSICWCYCLFLTKDNYSYDT